MRDRRQRLTSAVRRVDRAQVRYSSQRFVIWLIVAAVIGAATGVLVVLFQWVVLDVLWTNLERRPWLAVAAPILGLTGAWLSLRITRSPRSDTAEDYVRSYHDRRSRLRLRDLWGRLLAGVFTIGFGGSMGLEGPSILIGGSIGESVQKRLPRLFERDDVKTLLVAGGAAGISAVFKAPLTGLVFAMEVPFQDDVARNVLGPALIASAAGYLVEVAARGVEPLFPIVGHPTFSLGELGLSLLLGLLAGTVGRVVVRMYHETKRRLRGVPVMVRVIVAGAVLSGLGAASKVAFGSPLVLGPGEGAIRAAALGRLSWTALALLLAMKAVATAVTAGGDGVGGLFFPLVVMGTALGASFGGLIGGHGTLYSLVGMASLLGAAYHTPLAGVSFVAEATGSASFLVPAFVATAAAYATIGRASMSNRQRSRRAGPLESMLEVPVKDVMVDAAALHPTDPIATVIDRTLSHRRKTFSVIDDDGRFLGVIDVDTVLDVEALLRSRQVVSEHLRNDHPTTRADVPVHVAALVMSDAGVDYLPVVDEASRLVGVLLTSEVLKLKEIAEHLRA